MANKVTTTLLLFFILFINVQSINTNCSKNSSLIGLQSEFVMLQHQLRGLITLIDDCSFHVREFDMIQGSDVHWWGSIADDFQNLTMGFVISDQKLNQTYKNDTFVVHLNRKVTWDQINVVAVWDKPTASDFGHVILRNPINGTNSSSSVALSPSLAPSPAPSPLSSASVNYGKEGNYSYKQPTMFDNCKTLSETYRLRWTVDADLIDIGLEAIVESQNYMAFGWADPGSSSELMLYADVAVTGFTEEGLPFADDYYITKYNECLIRKDGSVLGVCPDTVYGPVDPVAVNNTRLVYGHRRDGVSLIRYQRPLRSIDKKYDVSVNATNNVTVIWALGKLRPPDMLQSYYLPQNHGGRPFESYGHLVFNVSERVNDCLGPLEAEYREDQDLVSAVGQPPLVVTTNPALHYPNPPNPSKVLYINKKEAPLLTVERGVPVTFSIQAGHDVALYITSDPIGGNATSRNMSETIYAGGPEAEGVPASPTELVWYPDRNTPDQVYYHSLYVPKMGWKVKVVDGGLSDMYNNSVLLDDQQVTFFWSLSNNSISLAARGEKKSGYLAIAFGRGMVTSYAYVGWTDDSGKGRVNSYWIDGKNAMSVHPTKENLTYVRFNSENGIITFEFTRPLIPSCHGESDKLECNNIIEPTTPLRVVWAMGAEWSEHHLSDRNMHSVTSSRPVRVLLLRGSAEAEQELRPVLAVHGFMMFVAWGILLPGGILAARYLKHVKGDKWFQIHVYLQYSGLVIFLLGLLFAVVELRGIMFDSVHVKIGLTAIFLACAQPINAKFRPIKPSGEEEASPKRLFWEYLHVITGRCAILAGIAALISGMKHLGDRYGGQNVQGLEWALIIWFLVVVFIVMYLEYQEKQKRRRERSLRRSNWVLGNPEEDDHVDLLHSSERSAEEGDSHPSERLEIQLEPLSR